MYCCSKDSSYGQGHNCHGANFATVAHHRCVTPAEGADSGHGTCGVISPGMNSDGANLESHAQMASGIEDCCNKCAENPLCAGFTLVNGNNECWLKGQGRLRKDHCVTSGIVARRTQADSACGSKQLCV